MEACGTAQHTQQLFKMKEPASLHEAQQYIGQ